MEHLKVLGTIFKLVITFLPWIIGLVGLHQWLYSKSAKYYFTILKLTSKRKDTEWKMTASFYVNKDIDFFTPLQKHLKEYGNYDRKFNLKNKKHYNFGRFSCTVMYDIDFEQNTSVRVDMLFDSLNVTLKNAKERLRELRQLFNNLEKELNLTDQNYNVNIEFTSMRNPFFGLMIQRLGEEHLEYFEASFPVALLLKKHNTAHSQLNNSSLRIFKNKITINESNFDMLEEVVIDSLLLR